MSDRSRPQPRRTKPSGKPATTAASPVERRCAWCGSTHTTWIKRGLIGPTDDRDQYVRCHECGKPTYEIIARSNRDLRIGQFKVGTYWRDTPNKTRYVIHRIIKAGFNEYLLYLRPVTGAPDTGPESDNSPL